MFRFGLVTRNLTLSFFQSWRFQIKSCNFVVTGGLDEPDLSTLVENHEDDDELDFESGKLILYPTALQMCQNLDFLIYYWLNICGIV